MSVKQMPHLKWDRKYETGISKFDSQHKVLFGYINELRDAMLSSKQGEDKREVQHVLDGLMKYTMTHFLEEEVAMYKIHYPHYEQHKELHNQFIFVVRNLYIKFKSGKTSSRLLVAELVAVLSNWLTEHIAEVDKNYGPFLAGKTK